MLLYGACVLPDNRYSVVYVLVETLMCVVGTRSYTKFLVRGLRDWSSSPRSTAVQSIVYDWLHVFLLFWEGGAFHVPVDCATTSYEQSETTAANILKKQLISWRELGC